MQAALHALEKRSKGALARTERLCEASVDSVRRGAAASLATEARRLEGLLSCHATRFGDEAHVFSSGAEPDLAAPQDEVGIPMWLHHAAVGGDIGDSYGFIVPESVGVWHQASPSWGSAAGQSDGKKPSVVRCLLLAKLMLHTCMLCRGIWQLQRLTTRHAAAGERLPSVHTSIRHQLPAELAASASAQPCYHPAAGPLRAEYSV